MKTPGKSATSKAATTKKAATAKKATTAKKPATASKRAKAAGKTIGKAAAKAIGKTLGRSLGTTANLVATAPAAPPRPAPTGEAMVLDRLYAVVMDRRTADPAISHSARLLSRGMPKVAQKFGEEAVECLIEAVAGNAEALIGESADVLYHLLVMWVAAGIEPDQVWAELARREGMSGVAEKAARPKDGGTTKIP